MENQQIKHLENVKVYLRNCQKYAKILYLPIKLTGKALYEQASKLYSLSQNKIHLYFKGVLIESALEVQLQQNGIIHIVNIDHTKLDSICVNVKKLKGRINTVNFEIPTNMKIVDFIDDKLFKVYGQKSDKIFLVFLGKALSLNDTFKQLQVQNQSQLLCLSIIEEEQQASEQQKQQNPDDNYIVNVAIKDLETPEEPKDIYMLPNFAINVPDNVQPTNLNTLNLIFDSKIRHSSSIHNIELDPSQIIKEDDEDFSDVKNNRSESYYSQKLPQNDSFANHKESCLSENLTHPQKQLNQKDQFFQKIQMKKNCSNPDALLAGDLIYIGDKNCLAKNDMMTEILDEFEANNEGRDITNKNENRT